MPCPVALLELNKTDSCRSLKLPSHDAEVPIDDCLPVYGCPVPSRINAKTLRSFSVGLSSLPFHRY